jgi:hypothetical protein
MPDNKKKIADDLKQGWNQFTEEVQTTGEKLVDEVKRLVEEGNVRKIRIVTEDGNVLLEIPLTAGVVVGGVAVIAAPLLAVLGTLAGIFAKVKLQVIREGAAPKEIGGSTTRSGRAAAKSSRGRSTKSKRAKPAASKAKSSRGKTAKKKKAS